MAGGLGPDPGHRERPAERPHPRGGGVGVRRGRYLATIDGREGGAGAFACPHGIWTSPCGSIAWGDELLIPELRARLAVLDGEDRLVCYLGQNEAVCDLAGWPNHERHLLEAGRFNSPHGMAADPDGNLYVVEWIPGGRITRLARAA